MTAAAPSLFHRDDTILGVCEGIGEDFDFNAQYLRVGLALVGFVNPAAAVALYALLGVAVFAGRKLFPNPVASTAAEPTVPAIANDADTIELAAAA